MSAVINSHTKNMANNQIKYDAIILGLGKTGLSCVRHLSGKGLSLAIADTRNTPPELMILKEEFSDIPIYLGEFDPQLLCSTKLLIVSPGVAISEPAIQYAMDKGIITIGDIELFVREVNTPIIAITGSNGKSTVATLITLMIKAAGLNVELGGNIGTPALSLLRMPQVDFYVLELSSFQLETVNSLNACVSVILNISPDHMDRYKTMDDYVLAKQKIYEGDGCVVINKNDEYLSSILNKNKNKNRNIVLYSSEIPEEGELGVKLIKNTPWIFFGNKKIIKISDLYIKGRHNISNALAALAIGFSIGIDIKPMVSALKQFKGLSHRCELIATINNIDWINDSKGTNPGASSAAIEGIACGNNIVWIAGGDSKGADFVSLAKSVTGRVHAVILIGRDANRIAAVLDKKIHIFYSTSMKGAVSVAEQVANPGDCVLLSPACASFDMFRDYQHRGEEFKKAVLSLSHEGS